MNKLERHWEDILESEGLGEVSLFDNTNKSRRVTFVSATPNEEQNDRQSADGGIGTTVEWSEHASIRIFGGQLRVEDMPEALYSRQFATNVRDLPEGWPSLDRRYLEFVAEHGFRRGEARASLGVNRNQAIAILKRFRTWIKSR